MIVLETERLVLRRLDLEDGELMLRQLNEPSFVQNVGDRGVRTVEEAREYIRNGAMASYEQNGYGLNVVELKDEDGAAGGVAVGTCGLINRDTLDDPDIGFAFFPEHWGRGYAREAAAACLEQGRREYGLERIVAITTPTNQGSIRVLESIGLRFERMIQFGEEAEELKFFAIDFP